MKQEIHRLLEVEVLALRSAVEARGARLALAQNDPVLAEEVGFSDSLEPILDRATQESAAFYRVLLPARPKPVVEEGEVVG